jgi:hypothetical protein
LASQDKLFLKCSVNTANALTNLFEFVWPASVALWNLQWQAKGFFAQVPEATVEQMHARFVLGSGVHGADLKKLAGDTAWEDLQQWFARLLLSESFALFEGWIEAAFEELEVPLAIRGRGNSSLDKKLQFPSKFDAAGLPVGGVCAALAKVQLNASSGLVSNCIYPELIKNKKYAKADLENMMICYRAFKEVRNDFTHHGGVASLQAQECFIAFEALNAGNLGLKEKPELPQVVVGKPIRLSIRGVVGLSDVVLRLIATLDSELVRSGYGDALIKRRWLNTHEGRKTVAAAGPKRDAHLIRLVRQCALPKPVALTALFGYLSSARLVV